MDKYIIFCSENQTRKAIELGAPLNSCYHSDDFQNTIKIGSLHYVEIPTAEQMVGWLRDQNIDCFVGKQSYARFMASVTTANCEFIYSDKYDTFNEAILAAIDAALDYLSNNKK